MSLSDLRSEIEAILSKAIDRAISSGQLNVPRITASVETPRDPSHGDFSTSAAMSLAKPAKRSPRDIAKIILENFKPPDGLLASPPEIVGPGFINFRLSPAVWRDAVRRINESGADYGRSDVGGGERVMIEFVSANPTGPLHVGHARGAAIGDSLARVLDFAGFDVKKEFYINDAGAQVEVLARTVHARWLELQGVKIDWEKVFPDKNYYPGDYVVDIAKTLPISKAEEEKFRALNPGLYDLSERDFAVREMLALIKKDLADFGVEFDVWFSESSLYQSGLAGKAIEKLRAQGDVYEKDGAVWFRVSKYQPEEEDRVIKKSSGETTYFASDIAYHWDKLERGFQRLINIWGADHHGYIGRMKASLEALGLPPDNLQVLLVQMVNLVRGGEPVRMGKRTGEFVTLREVMDEVGKDAMRFTFLTRGSVSHLDFDIDVLKAKPGDDSEMKMSQLREKNPVYYVQYAHARSRAIFRKAAETGISADASLNADLSRLALPEELDLARKIEGFTREVAMAATAAEPHRISHYLIELAGDFHRYYYMGDKNPSFRVLTGDKETCAARLALVGAIRWVIHNGLNLLGVDAPERM